MEWKILVNAAKVAVGVTAGFFLSLHPLLQALLVFMVLDIVSGILAAYITKTLDSDVSFRGMAKKALMLLLVGGAVAMQRAWQLDVPLGAIVAGFYCAQELLSITENAARAGLPLPKQLTDALKKIQEQ